jgi:hypothetical protein
MVSENGTSGNKNRIKVNKFNNYHFRFDRLQNMWDNLNVAKEPSKGFLPYVIVISISIAGVASLLYFGPPTQKYFDLQKLNQSETKIVLHPTENAFHVDSYIKALQTRDCEYIIRVTWWMQERLRNELAKGTSQKDLDSIKLDMCNSMFQLENSDYLLSLEGLVDGALFPQGVEWKVLGADAGINTLSKPVLERIWVELTYSGVPNGPKTNGGIPLKSIVAGVNISKDQYILKGDIRGNWNIDQESLLF